MNKQLPWPLCVNLRRDRKVPFATFHNLVLLIMGVCLGCGSSPDHSAACPAIEVSAVADVQSDSTRSVVLSDGTKIPLTRTPLVTSADLTGANASLTEGQWVLNVDVTDEGAKRVQVFSKQNVGRTMVFLIDGKVYSTPRILDPITGNGFLIGGFEQADAERLATAINNGCKRKNTAIARWHWFEPDADQLSGSQMRPAAGPRRLNPEPLRQSVRGASVPRRTHRQLTNVEAVGRSAACSLHMDSPAT